jgi:RNA polymerase sigma factor (TIGR02999 family)
MAPTEGANRQPSEADITGLLRKVEAGETDARNSLFEQVYTDLYRRADDMMRRQPDGHTLQATALVNEVFLRLCGPAAGPWNDRKHFLLAAARAMRSILVDHARRKATNKRGAGRPASGLDEVLVSYEDRSLDLLALQEALVRLERVDPAMAQAVELRFFGGATAIEAAHILEVPQRTFNRRWQMTRAWLYKEVK